MIFPTFPKNMDSRFLAIVVAWLAVSSRIAFATQGVVRMLYTTPNSSFIENPSGDTTVTVNDTSGSIATLQSEINSARTSNPSAIIEIFLQSGSTYTVSATSLTLGSNECLVGTGAVIQAASSSGTAPLIEIPSGSTNVSVAGVFLNGNGADIDAIDALSSNRVNIDAVTAENCGSDIILLNGNGQTTFDNEMTVTRCTTYGSPNHAGISIWNATQAVCVDNYCYGSSVGIWISDTDYTGIVNNTCIDNATGIDLNDGSYVSIANNTCNNNGTGIVVASAASKDIIASNALASNTTAGISSAGSNDTFTDNLFGSGNGTNFSTGGSGNYVIAYDAPLSASGQNYFYPPLIDNQHNDAIVNGMGRSDLYISSTTTTLASIQSQYNAVLSASSGNVTVLHIPAGTYTVGSSPLTLSSYTCILLSGTIQVNSSTTASSVVTGSGANYISISGGTIDGDSRTGRNAIDWVKDYMAQVDAMTLRNFGADGTREGGSDIVHYNGGCTTPIISTRNTLNSGAARGFWSELNNAQAVYTDNNVSNVNEDGIDCDALTQGALVKFNTSSDNVRDGVFIEQSAMYNLDIGNVFNGDGCGTEVYNNGQNPPTEYNTVACNMCYQTGLRCGSTGTNSDGSTTTTSHNFFFDNVAQDASGDGFNGQVSGTDNYLSQTYLAGNSTEYTTTSAQTYFNSLEPGGNRYIHDSNSGLGVEVLNSSTSAVAAVVTGTTTGAGNDEWLLYPTDSGYYKVQNLHSGMVWNVNGASNSPGATIIQYPYAGSGNDEWMPVPTGAGLYNFICRSSGLYLQVTGSSLAPGTQLDQWTADGGPEEAFSLSLTSPPTLTPIKAQSIVEDGSTGALSITVTDAQAAAGSLTLSATSTNPTLAPSASFLFGGSGSNRTINIVPANLESGTAGITFTVSDNLASVSSTFSLTVIEEPPTISSIPNQSIGVNETSGAIGFTVGDDYYPLNSLTLSASSANTSLVPYSGISFGGSGGSRTVSVTPAANTTGTTSITVTVNDGQMTASSTFKVTVTPSPMQSWDDLYFGTYSNTGEAADTADPAGDGVPNIIKYALGMDPLVNSQTGLPTVSINGGDLQIQFHRNTSATDVGYTVSASTNLLNWTPIASRAAGAGSWSFSGASVIDAAGAVTVTDETPIDSEPGYFLELIVTGS